MTAFFADMSSTARLRSILSRSLRFASGRRGEAWLSWLRRQTAGEGRSLHVLWPRDGDAMIWSSSSRFSRSRRKIDAAEAIGFVHPEDRPVFAAAGDWEREDAPSEIIVRIGAGDAWIALRLLGAFHRDPHGVAGYSAIAVAAPRQAEDAASRTPTLNRYAHDALDAVRESLVLWDRRNRLVMCNDAYRRFFNLKDEDAQPGMAYRDVMERAAAPKTLRRTVIEENDDDAVCEIELEDRRWMRIEERRIGDGGFISVGYDITALKRRREEVGERERALRQAIGDLQRSNKKLGYNQRQVVHWNRRNALAMDRAEAAARSKNVFLANMNHELRTPLNVIIGFSEMMKDKLFGPLGDPRYEAYARDIWHSGKYLLELIDRVLELSRLEGGRWPLKRVAISLPPLFDECLRIAAAGCRNKKLTFASEADPACEAYGDRLALKQILLNLLSNSVKFTDDGGSIAVKAVRRDEEVEISVIDDGIGIPASRLPHLARPFEVVWKRPKIAPRDGRGGGSGIGLALARSFVEMHGGKLSIESDEGKGTQVTFNLAAARIGAPQAASA